MICEPGDLDLPLPAPGDRRYHRDRLAARPQCRALLDMYLDESAVGRGINALARQALGQYSMPRTGLEVSLAGRVPNLSKVVCIERPNPDLAAGHAETERGPFLFGKDDDFKRRCRLSVVVRGAQDFQWREYADNTIEIAAVRDSVQVRAAQPQRAGPIVDGRSQMDIARSVGADRTAAMAG